MPAPPAPGIVPGALHREPLDAADMPQPSTYPFARIDAGGVIR